MVFFIYATIQFKNKNKSTIPKTIYALHPNRDFDETFTFNQSETVKFTY